MPLGENFQKLKKLLSDDDQLQLENLAKKLQSVNGNFELLDDKDKALIIALEKKYGHAFGQTIKEKDELQDIEFFKNSYKMLDTEFGTYVKNMLTRELREQFSTFESMVQYAYDKKWMPAELQNPDVCETLFERFFSDIDKANQWRNQLSDASYDMTDKNMAVGLTWFIYIYQLKTYIEEKVN